MTKFYTAIILLALALVGCRAQRVEYRTEYRTDTISVSHTDTLRLTEWRLRIDSVAVRDTTRVYLDGETKVVERTKFVDRWRIDSTGVSELRARCDSLAKAKSQVQVVKEVRTEGVKWWQKVLMWLGVAAVVTAGVMALAAVKDKRIGRKIVDYICRHEDSDNKHR